MKFRGTKLGIRAEGGYLRSFRTIAITLVGLCLLTGAAMFLWWRHGKNAKAPAQHLAEKSSPTRGPAPPPEPKQEFADPQSLDARAKELETQDKYAEAEPLRRQIVALRRKKGTDEELIRSLHDLKVVWSWQKRFAEMEPLCREIVDLQTKLSGPDDRMRLNLLSELADVLVKEEKFSEAEQISRELLQRAQARLGPDDPDVEDKMVGVAWTLQLQGKLAEAEPIYREILQRGQKRLGPQHLEVAFKMCHVAWILQLQGKLAEAEQIYREALAIYRKHPEADPIDQIANTESSLAWVLRDAGKYAEAESLYREVLASCEKSGKGHEYNVAWAEHDLGLCLQKLHRGEEALPLHEKANQYLQRLRHVDFLVLDLAWSNYRLASCLHDLGRNEEAISLTEKALLILPKGYTYAQKRRAKEAREALAEWKMVLAKEEQPSKASNENPKLAGMQSNTATTAETLDAQAKELQAQMKDAEAEPLRRQIVALHRKKGTDEELIRSLHKLAELVAHEEKFAEVELLCREILTLNTKLPGLKVVDQGAILAMLAGALTRQEKFAEAEQAFRESLWPKQKRSPLEEQLVPENLAILAGILHCEGKLAEAEQYYRQILAIYDKNPDIAPYFVPVHKMCLASVLRDAGKYAEAESLCREALDGYAKKLGPEATLVALGQHELGLCLQKLHRAEEALPLHEHADRLLQRPQPGLQDQEQVLARSLSSYYLAFCLHELGRDEKAITLGEKALPILEKSQDYWVKKTAKELREALVEWKKARAK